MTNVNNQIKIASLFVICMIVLVAVSGCRSHKRIPVTYRDYSVLETLDSQDIIIGRFYQKSPNFQAASDLVRLLERQFSRTDLFENVLTDNNVIEIPDEHEGIESIMKVLAETDWLQEYPDRDADLLLTGAIAYLTKDRSGYDSEWREDRYGYRVPQKVYRNRIAFDLQLGFLLVDLRTGEVIFNNIYDDSDQVEGAADEISIFFDLIDEQTEEFLDELLGKKQQTYRFLVYK